MIKQSIDGRIIIVMLFVAYCSIFLVVKGYTNFTVASLAVMGMPAKQPSFSDLRVIQAASHSLQDKLNPYKNNPYDPWKRTYNYPPIWIYLLGQFLTPSNIYIFGIVMIIAFVVTVFIFIGHIPISNGFYYAVVVVNPVTFLLFERANIDIFIFILTTIYIYFLTFNRQKSVYYLLGLFLSFISILKLYPIFCLSGVIQHKKTFYKLMLVTVFVFVVYLVSIANLLPLIAKNTPHTYTLSYGCAVLPMILNLALMDTGMHKLLTTITPYLTGLTLMAIMTSVAIYYGLKHKKIEPNNDTIILLAFRIGVGLFIGTFALGNNWDYRLVVLILTVPQLIEWRRNQIFNTSFISSVLAIIPVLMNWMMISSEHRYNTLIIKQLVSWYLVVSLIYIYVRTRPAWLFSLKQVRQ